MPLAEISTAGVIIAVKTASDAESPSMLFKIYSGFSLEANHAWLALQTAPAFLSFDHAQEALARLAAMLSSGTVRQFSNDYHFVDRGRVTCSYLNSIFCFIVFQR